MNRGHLLAAAGVVLVANAVAVGLAAYNWSGAPASTIVLTERELSLPPADPENTGIWLNFRWQDPSTDLSHAEAQARMAHDRAVLEALGFDCSRPVSDADARKHYQRMLARTGFIVFEYDGESWKVFEEQVSRGALDRPAPEQPSPDGDIGFRGSAQRLRQERLGGSRLIPVDAGTDPSILRQRYPDTARFLIVPGVMRLRLIEPTKTSPGRLTYDVTQAWPMVIHVPKEHRAPLEPLARDRKTYENRWFSPGQPPRFEVTLSYGRRYEPWVSGVRLLAAGK